MRNDGIGANVPVHVSIIMDGNGRWARVRGQERWKGHVEGVESVKAVLEEAGRAGVKYMSLYAFSEENWNRDAEEVSALMTLMAGTMESSLPLMMEKNVRLVVLGNVGRLSEGLKEAIGKSMAATAGNDGITLIIFLSYSGRWDILQAVREVARRASSGLISGDELTADVFSSLLVTAAFPDPDLIIRTSGEQRLSNYMLWQGAYSEFYFTDTLWPDFRGEEFLRALREYGGRERRYGKIK